MSDMSEVFTILECLDKTYLEMIVTAMLDLQLNLIYHASNISQWKGNELRYRAFTLTCTWAFWAASETGLEHDLNTAIDDVQNATVAIWRDKYEALTSTYFKVTETYREKVLRVNMSNCDTAAAADENEMEFNSMMASLRTRITAAAREAREAREAIENPPGNYKH